MGRQLIDLTGQKFNNLTVIEYDRTYNGASYWLCRCDCGNEKVIAAQSLKTGNTKGCGCMKHKRPNPTKCQLYRSYRSMLSRCYDELHDNYQNYGEKGIKVEESIWLEEKVGFFDFKEWAYSIGYEERKGKNKLTLDRIHNSKGYSKENCRWVTMKEQQNNKTNNRLFTHNGKTQNITQWAEELNMNRYLIYGRLRQGKTFEESITIKRRIHGN